LPQPEEGAAADVAASENAGEFAEVHPAEDEEDSVAAVEEAPAVAAEEEPIHR
jgi:hypothetical protein